jgi:4-amino-4-deoxy-L-arabinose transferase-like glycosyltransferase
VERLLRSPRTLLALIGGYLLWQVILRLLIGGGLGLDEGEQLILSQRLQPGYGPQPPLYTWLQIGLLRLGDNPLLSLSLLKNGLLFVTYAAVYLTARRLCPTPESAALAALSLLLLPQIGWESQRDLTHSVLVTTISALTLWLVLGMTARRAQWADYVWLGILLGLGVLAKLNYLLFFTALLLALASLDRCKLLRPGLLLSLFIGMMVASPYLLWVVDNPDAAGASLGKFDTDAGGLAARAAGIWALTRALVSFVALPLLIYWLVFRTWPDWRRIARDPARRDLWLLLVRTLWIGLGLLLLFMLFSGAERLKDRWLLPLLFSLPLLLFAPGLPAGPPQRSRRYLAVLLSAMLLIPVGLAARVWVGPLLDQYGKPHFPAELLARGVRQAFPAPALVLAEDSLIAGNLKLYLDQAFVSFPPQEFPLRAIAGRRPLLLAWDAGKLPAPPPELLAYLRRHFPGRTPDAEPVLVRAPLLHSEDRSFRLGLLQVPAARRDAGASEVPVPGGP